MLYSSMQTFQCRDMKTTFRLWLTLFEGVIDVEQRQVVSVDVSKPHLGLVGCLLSLRGADKNTVGLNKVGMGPNKAAHRDE